MPGVGICRPLYGVLHMICGEEVGARFWTTFASVLLVLEPLFLVFAAATGAQTMAELVRRSVYLGSFGVIGAFLVRGAAVMLSGPARPWPAAVQPCSPVPAANPGRRSRCCWSRCQTGTARHVG